MGKHWIDIVRPITVLLIAAGAGFGMIMACRLSSKLLFDKRARLRLDRLSKPGF